MKKSKVLTSFISVSLLLGVTSCGDSKEEVEVEVIDIYDPYSLIEAGASSNYTLRLTIDEYISSESIQTSDYNNENYDIDSLKESLSWDNCYTYTIYYTDRAVLSEFYIDYGSSQTSPTYFIYINDNDTHYGEVCRCFYSSGGAFTSNGLYSGKWQDFFYSLSYFVSSGYNNPTYFKLTSQTGDYDIYDITSTSALRNLTYCAGLDWAYEDIYDEYYLLTFLGLKYYTAFQKMSLEYEEYYFLPIYNINNHISKYQYAYDLLNATFYDVGLTNIDDVINKCLS